MPRRSRSRRRRGPNVSCSDIANLHGTQFPRRENTRDPRADPASARAAADVPVIRITMVSDDRDQVLEFSRVVPLPERRDLLPGRLADSLRFRRIRTHAHTDSEDP